jgi:hypothetical protein
MFLRNVCSYRLVSPYRDTTKETSIIADIVAKLTFDDKILIGIMNESCNGRRDQHAVLLPYMRLQLL